MANNLNEVRTLFTLDAKDFEQQVKGLDSLVDRVNTNIKQSSKESLALSKELINVKKALQDVAKQSDSLKNDKSFSTMNSDIKETISNINKLNTNLVQYRNYLKDIKSDAANVSNSFKDGINLSGIGKLSSLVKGMKSTDVIDLKNINAAKSSIDRLTKDLKNVKLDVDTTALRNSLGNASLSIGSAASNDSLKHWVDNNGNKSGQDSDDTQRILKEILDKIIVIASGQMPKEEQKGGQDNNTNNVQFNMDRQRNAFIAQMNSKLTTLLSNEGSSTAKLIVGLSKIESQIVRAAEAIESAILTDEDIKNGYNRRYSASGVNNPATGEFMGVDAKNIFGNYFDKILDEVQEAKIDFEAILATMKQIDTVQSNIAAAEAQMANATEEDKANLAAQLELLKQEELAHKETLVAQKSQMNTATDMWKLQRHITDEIEKQKNELKRLENGTQSPFGGSADNTQKIADIKKTINMLEQEKTTVKQTADSYNKLGKEGSETGRLLMQYFGKKFPGVTSLIDESKDLGGVFKSLSGSIKGTSGAALEGDAALAGMGSSAGGAGAALGTVAIAAAAAVVAVVAIAAACKLVFQAFKTVISAAKEFDDAVGKVGAQLRLTGEELSGFKETLISTFSSQGLTSDINEVAQAIRLVTQAFKGVDESFTDEDAQRLATRLLVVSKATDYDVKEIIRAQQRLMINMKMNADDALDLIMGTYQATGDLNDDMLDTFSEYSSQMQKLGYSANFFYGIMTTGAQAGIMNLDKAADAVKEFNLRMSGDVEKSKIALNQLGLSYDALMADFQTGGQDAEKAFGRVVTAIAGMQDKAKQQSVIAELFGAPGEDVGSNFFKALAEAGIAVDGFKGSVEDAAAALENTLGYQVTELQNSLKGMFGNLGDGLVPAIKSFIDELNANFDSIQEKIEGILQPAFLQLGADILVAFNLDHIESWSDLLIGVVQIFADMITFVGGVVKAISFVANAFKLVFDVVAFLVQAFILGLETIGLAVVELVVLVTNGFTQILLAVFGVCEGIVRGFDDAFMLIIKGVGNLGIGIVNGITSAAKTAANAFIEHLINPIITAYNNTIGNLPGVSKLSKAGKFSSASGSIKYISIQKEFTGLGDAFSGENESFKAMGTAQKQFNAAYSDAFKAFSGPMNAMIKAMDESAGSMANEWSTIVNIASTDSNEAIKRLQKLVKESKLTEEQGKKTEAAIKKIFGNDDKKYNGKNLTADELKSLKDAAKEAAKAAEEAYKAKQELAKKMLDNAKENAKINRDFEEVIFDQQAKLVGEDSVEGIKKQIEFIDTIKAKYILTADEIIDYTSQQFDLSLKLRDKLVDDLKSSMEKELEQFKKTKQTETDIVKEENDKQIRELKKKIAAIDAIMRQNEYNQTQEDIDRDIAKLEKEYLKYQFATSFEGIQKRTEIQDELAEKRREKERSQAKKVLEDQKQGYQDEIDRLTEASEEKQRQTDKAISEQETAYETMYNDLEKLFEDKENLIQNIRNRILTEKNAEMKAQMEQFVKDYEDAEKRMQQSTLKMQDMQNWRINDAKRQYQEGKMTGDTDAMRDASEDAKDARQNGGTIGSADKLDKSYLDAGSEEYQYFKGLGKKWGELEKQKAGASADKVKKLKAEQDALRKEADALRKKYGVKYPADIPKWPVKYHTGGVVKDYLADAQGEVAAKLLPGEVVFTERQFNNMVGTFDRIMSYGGMNGSFNGSPGSVTNNYYGPMVNIENVNNSTNADFRKMSGEMDVWANRRARANGTRKI